MFKWRDSFVPASAFGLAVLLAVLVGPVGRARAVRLPQDMTPGDCECECDGFVFPDFGRVDLQETDFKQAIPPAFLTDEKSTIADGKKTRQELEKLFTKRAKKAERAVRCKPPGAGIDKAENLGYGLAATASGGPALVSFGTPIAINGVELDASGKIKAIHIIRTMDANEGPLKSKGDGGLSHQLGCTELDPNKCAPEKLGFLYIGGTAESGIGLKGHPNADDLAKLKKLLEEALKRAPEQFRENPIVEKIKEVVSDYSSKMEASAEQSVRASIDGQVINGNPLVRDDFLLLLDADGKEQENTLKNGQSVFDAKASQAAEPQVLVKINFSGESKAFARGVNVRGVSAAVNFWSYITLICCTPKDHPPAICVSFGVEFTSFGAKEGENTPRIDQHVTRTVDFGKKLVAGLTGDEFPVYLMERDCENAQNFIKNLNKELIKTLGLQE